MLRKYSLIGVIIIFLFTCGCVSTQSIKELSLNYQENSAALKEFAQITADDWLFGSGMIQGALDANLLPAWVFEDLQEIDAWFIAKDGTVITDKVLNEFELGYITGIKFKMFSPLIRGAIEQYAPALLNVAEVVAVLTFLGI